MQRVHDEPLSFRWSGLTDEQLEQAGLLPVGNHKLRLARCAMAASLVCAYLSGRWVSYSRDRNYYAQMRRYEGPAYTYATIIKLVDEFTEKGLLIEDRACPGRLGWRSRMKATDKLMNALVPWQQYLIPCMHELIRLVGASDKLIDYVDTGYTRVARKAVAAMNEAFQSTAVSLVSADVLWRGLVVIVDGQPFCPSRLGGYRVFNGCWTLGGRYYGPFWQRLSKKRRLELTIDGEPVDEHDFAQLHPQLLYAELGSRPGGDSYTIAHYEKRRELVKTAWQMMVNAPSRRSALTALAIDLGGLQCLHQAAELLKALENHHQPIAPAFYTGAGLRLQWQDSELMIRIERRCLSEGIIALPVHDSFITKQGHESARVREIMDDELRRLLRDGIDEWTKNQK